MFEKEEIEKKAIKWVQNVFPNDEFKQSGISSALVEFAELGYNKANERLTKAKKLLTRWVELFKPKGGNIPPTPIQVETEQFLSGQPEQVEELKKMAAQLDLGEKIGTVRLYGKHGRYEIKGETRK